MLFISVALLRYGFAAFLIENCLSGNQLTLDASLVSGTHSIILTVSDYTAACLFPENLPNPTRAISTNGTSIDTTRY